MTKAMKTEQELRELIMSEIRKHPNLSHVSNVGITRPVNHDWDAAFVCNGPKISGPQAAEIVRNIRAEFDLAS